VFTDASSIKAPRDPYTDGGKAGTFDSYTDGTRIGKADPVYRRCL